MLPSIGGLEFLIIIILLIIFVSPKDLPALLRTMGKAFGKLKRLTQEFKSTINDISKESRVDEINQISDKAKSIDLNEELTNSINNKIKYTADDESREDDK